MQIAAIYVQSDNQDVIKHTDDWAKSIGTSRSLLVLSILREKFGLCLDRKERALLEELDYQLSEFANNKGE